MYEIHKSGFYYRIWDVVDKKYLWNDYTFWSKRRADKTIEKLLYWDNVICDPDNSFAKQFECIERTFYQKGLKNSTIYTQTTKQKRNLKKTISGWRYCQNKNKTGARL